MTDRTPVKIARKGINGFVPGFLYPKPANGARIPVTRDIVIELEKRDFRVQGVKVIFGFSGYGMTKFKLVSNIICEEMGVNMFFCYIQGALPCYDNMNDVAGIYECHIPKFSCILYDNNPTVYEYTGESWTVTKKTF